MIKNESNFFRISNDVLRISLKTNTVKKLIVQLDAKYFPTTFQRTNVILAFENMETNAICQNSKI